MVADEEKHSSSRLFQTLPTEFRNILDTILSSNSSVNMYMFQGGTSFGFMAGANWIDVNPSFTPDVSSYGTGHGDGVPH